MPQSTRRELRHVIVRVGAASSSHRRLAEGVAAFGASTYPSWYGVSLGLNGQRSSRKPRAMSEEE